MMEVLSAISRLLDYPDDSILLERDGLAAMIADSSLPPEQKVALQSFIEQRFAMDLFDWQSEYDGLFERGRSLGLWLFEHVHGESRDRGQAMVDLMKTYTDAGLMINEHELPDYIPLFLEFLSTQGEANAKAWLQDVEHILALLFCRLEKRASDYAVLFDTLLKLSGCALKLDELRKQVNGEQRDDTKQAIDKEWEEEEVTFGADSLEKSCSSSARKPSENQRRDLDIPISWVDFDTTKPANQSNKAARM
jgi:nitrate reductase delta subunit